MKEDSFLPAKRIVEKSTYSEFEEQDFQDKVPYDGVPTAFCSTRKKVPLYMIEEPQLKSFSFARYQNEEVEILVSGFWARGKLIGADEESLYLRGVHRWWVYPLEKISQMRLLDVENRPLGATPKDIA